MKTSAIVRGAGNWALILSGAAMLFCLVSTGECAVTSQSQNLDTVGQYEKFELTLILDGNYSDPSLPDYKNPFDPAAIDVRVTFTEPDGTQKTIPAFYYIEYDVVPGSVESYVNGRNPCWKARFAPTQPGVHSYDITVTDASGTQTTAGAHAFSCVASGKKGFIRVDPRDSLLLRRQTGEQFFPIGHNQPCCGMPSGLASWTKYFAALNTNGATWSRLWMSSLNIGENIEWTPVGIDYASVAAPYYHGVGQYGMEIAWRIDHVVELAEQYDVTLQVALQYFQQFQPEYTSDGRKTGGMWSKNPYNIVNAAYGGWLNSPGEFLTDAEARRFTKNKFRYIIARWGYSTAIYGWELCNEIGEENTFDNNWTNINAWLAEMGQFVKDTDVFGHLVTTSVSAANPAESLPIWNMPCMDIVQLHSYTANTIDYVQSSTKRFHAYAKPVFTGEFSIDIGGAPTDDTIGLNMHNGIWTAFHMKSGAHEWYSSYVQNNGLIALYKPLALYAEGESFGEKALTNVPVRTTTPNIPSEPFFQSNAPGWSSWTAVPAQTTFTVDRYGLIGNFSVMNRYVHGIYKEAARSDPVLQTCFGAPAILRLTIPQVSAYGPNSLEASIDGVSTASLTPPNSATNLQWEIEIPAGTHTVQIKNTGRDWFEINNYAFSCPTFDTSPFLKTVCLAGADAGYLWIYDIDSQYGHTAANGVFDGVTFALPGLVNGTYQVEYYNTWDAGGLAGTEEVTVTDGNLTGAVPSFSRDIAVKVKRVSEPQPNTAPVANGQDVTLAEGSSQPITLGATDADGDALTYAIVTGPAHGTLSGGGQDLIYTPAAGYYGTDSFTFKANDGMADSGLATVSITVTPFLKAPSGLSAKIISSNQIALTWADNEASETGYRIERSTDGVTFAEIATAGANALLYVNIGCATGVTYSYRIRAYRGTTFSGYSNTASARITATAPSAPTGLTIASATASSITLSWTDRSTNETGFKIERRSWFIFAWGSWSEIATVRANATKYTNIGLRKNTKYSYRIRAYNSAGASVYSEIAAGKTSN